LRWWLWISCSLVNRWKVLLPDHPYLPLTPTTWREVLSSIELFSAVGFSIFVDCMALQVSVSSKIAQIREPSKAEVS
jgi:ABC-type ATPase involved in cell division